MSTTVAVFFAVAPNSNIELGTRDAIKAVSIRQVSEEPIYVDVSELNHNGFVVEKRRYQAQMMATFRKLGHR